MFKLSDLVLTASDRAEPADVYCAIDTLIFRAHRAEEFEICFEALGTFELFAWLYGAATDIWRGMDNGISRNEAIATAEVCFHDIYQYYTGYYDRRR